jgi:hypothetical protein
MANDRTVDPAAASAVVLLRTHSFEAVTRSFFSRLSAETGHRAVLLADDSARMVYGDCEKIGFTRQVYESMGLLCPDDFGWRCGDYGLYLARRSFPKASHFWLVEYDVRLAVPHLRRFFETFEGAPDFDLIAPSLSRRYADWPWYSSLANRHDAVYGCLFPLLRVSARAVDYLAERRIRMSATWKRESATKASATWPNDEAFVATELVAGHFRCRDLNGFGREVYNDATFGFGRPIRGETFDALPADGMAYHSVLYGAAYDEKLRRMASQRQKDLKTRAVGRFRRLKAVITGSAQRLAARGSQVDFGG